MHVIQKDLQKLAAEAALTLASPEDETLTCSSLQILIRIHGAGTRTLQRRCSGLPALAVRFDDLPHTVLSVDSVTGTRLSHSWKKRRGNIPPRANTLVSTATSLMSHRQS